MEDDRAPIRRVDGVPSLVALTVDDCDDPEAWAAILDALRDRDAAATLFPSGMRVEEFPALARWSRSEGHLLGSHGHDHARLAGRSLREVRANLERDASVWRRVLGDHPRLFRPPFGAWDANVLRAAAAVGSTTMVLWDVDPEDWHRPNAEEIVRRTLTGVREGSIVLLHAVPETAEALRRMLPALRRRGLLPTTVTGLLAAGTPA